MSRYNPAEYGDKCADFYDRLYPAIETGLLETLTDFARGGPVLELGLATGRVARRLSGSGIEVHGVEASSAMIERCRSQPDAKGLNIVQADFAALPFEGHFSLVFALVSTLSLLPSLELLSQCLKGVADALRPGGVFVYEAFGDRDRSSPTTREYPVLTDAGVSSYRVTSLETSLSTFDKLAAAAGLRLSDTWQDWRQNAVTPSTERHIMVYTSA